MRVRRIDKDGDWTFGQGRNNYADGGECVAQRVCTRLRSFQGDWFLDLEHGLVLLGQLRQGGADWTLLSGGTRQQWTDQAGSTDALLGDAGNAMADRVGRQLNVIGGGSVEGKLWVSGLDSATAYAGLLSALRADSSVLKVATLGAQDDGALLDVKASLPLPALAAGLAAGGHFLQAPAHDGADASLRWLH